MAARILFITGTDTNVGKTVFAAMLTRHLHQKGVRVAALKPLCSGGREDARLLRAAGNNVLPLDEINPWHFRAPIAPLLAARKEGKRVELHEVTKHIRKFQERFETLIVEGAGGLLSPLGEQFDSRNCLLELNAIPIVVCPNRLGAINQILLVLAALPKRSAKQAQIILMSPPKPTSATRQNFEALQEFVDCKRIHHFPWVKNFPAQKNRAAEKVLEDLLSQILSVS